MSDLEKVVTILLASKAFTVFLWCWSVYFIAEVVINLVKLPLERLKLKAEVTKLQKELDR